jgi:hypothetical protein
MNLLEFKRQLGFSLKPESTFFLERMYAIDESSIDRMFAFVQKYQQKDVRIDVHFCGLLDTLRRQVDLFKQTDQSTDQVLDEFLAGRDINYEAITHDLYKNKWRQLITQAHEQGLTYHNIYHSMEVTARTLLGAKHLGLFSGDDKRNCLLRFLLLNAAKYHDFIQRPRGIVISSDYATAEEETAALVATWMIESLEISPESELAEWVKLFFKQVIYIGSTPVFGADGSFLNLSTLYSELEEITSSAGMQTKPAHRKSVKEMQAACEVINVMDKVSPSCLLVTQNQRCTQQTNTRMHLEMLLAGDLALHEFYSKLPSRERYYEDYPAADNLEAFFMFEVSHTEMQCELQGAFPQAMIISDFIKRGQNLYRTDPASRELSGMLQRVLTEDTLKDALSTVYFEKIESEIKFVSQLPDIAHTAALKLRSLGYLNELRQSEFAATQPFRRHSAASLAEAKSDSPPQISNPNKSQSCAIFSFIDPSVPEKEAVILKKFAKHYRDSENMTQRRIAQEILAVSICQPGIAYVNEPHIILDEFEPRTPLNCKTPESKIESEVFPVGRTRYALMPSPRYLTSQDALAPTNMPVGDGQDVAPHSIDHK